MPVLCLWASPYNSCLHLWATRLILLFAISCKPAFSSLLHSGRDSFVNLLVAVTLGFVLRTLVRDGLRWTHLSLTKVWGDLKCCSHERINGEVLNECGKGKEAVTYSK